MNWRKIPVEAIIWFSALLFLACYTPSENTHFTICPLSLAGIGWCPGCGLGHAVSWLFHGHWQRSFDAHPLGIFAVIVLSFRIITLTKNYLHHGKNC